MGQWSTTGRWSHGTIKQYIPTPRLVTNLVQFPGCFSRTHYVIPALDDSCRNMTYLVEVVKDLSVAAHKSTVYEIMSVTHATHNARDFS